MTNENLFQGAIALITGANKGIGYEIARGLGARQIVVMIGARDETRGQAAAIGASEIGMRRSYAAQKASARASAICVGMILSSDADAIARRSTAIIL